MNKKVLIIDNSALHLEINSQVLKQAGYDVVTTTTANDGLEKLKNEQINLVILELILPGLDGFAFINICKKDPAIKEIPIIVLTNRYSEEEMNEAKKLGAREYLTKYNTSPTHLEEKVKEFLENQY